MSMTTHRSNDGAEFTFRVYGPFDFEMAKACLREFRNVQDRAPARVTFDLSDATRLETSALGTLLILRGRILAANADAAIVLANCRPEVAKMLELVEFRGLFEVQDLRRKDATVG